MSSLGLRKFCSTRLILYRHMNTSKVLLSTMPNRVGINPPRWLSTASSDHDMKTVTTMYQKFFSLPDGAKINRHNFVSKSEEFVKAADKVEAYFINSILMKWADLYGLDKFPEEGGKEYTCEEMYRALKKIPKETLDFYTKVAQRSLFRAIDTNNNGYISRDEWATHLKIQNLYESDEQALRSFDSLDKNKDGQISMEEYEESGEKFWGNSVSEVSDLFGTSSTAGSDNLST